MNRAGRLLGARILRSSGSPALDRAALETLRRAQPLPSIPEDMPDEVGLDLPVAFYLK
jgi:protein TonB